MIICGYQGIGKSTLVKNTINTNLHVIDLESGNFWVDGERCIDWYKYYAQIAIHLSQQGNIVMMSSHKVVRDYLRDINRTERLATIYPENTLREKWIKKLEDRYTFTKKDKDYKALMNAKNMYLDNVYDLATQSGFDHICLRNDNYYLDGVILQYMNLVNSFPNEGITFMADDVSIILREGK